MAANRVESRRTDRIALVGATLLGMAICAPGIGKVAAAGQWLSLAGIGGTALGVALLAMVGARVLNRPFGPIADDRTAIGAMVAVSVVKFVLGATV